MTESRAIRGRSSARRCFVLTNAGAPRYRVFQVDLGTPDRKYWKEIIAQSDAVIDFMKVVGGRLFVGYLRDAHSELAVFSSDGKPQGEIPLPKLGTVSGFRRQAGPAGGVLRIQFFHYAAERSFVSI